MLTQPGRGQEAAVLPGLLKLPTAFLRGIRFRQGLFSVFCSLTPPQSGRGMCLPEFRRYAAAIMVLSIMELAALDATGQSAGMPGFFLEGWQPKTIEMTAFDTVASTTLTPTVTVTVDAGQVVTRVVPNVYGHNAAAWGGKLDLNTTSVKHITQLNPHVIRWPGGSMSNDYFWGATSKETRPKDLPATYEFKDLQYGRNNRSWTMSVDNYYSLLSKTGASGNISVNYSYARIGTSEDPVRAAARYAADWVRYDKGRTLVWEIGNENFGSWEVGYQIDTNLNKDGQPKTINGDLYGRHCKVFIEEMRKAANEVGVDIKIGVVAMDSHVTWNTVQQNWNSQMMKQVGSLADFFIVHSYYTPYNENSSVSTILNSGGKAKDIAQYVTTGLKSHAGLNPRPLAMTEWNIFATGSGQGVSYINGMHAALVLGELIKNKYGQGNRWDFVNGWDNGNNHGLFADGETGIARYTPRAPFHYMYYFQKFFGDKMIASAVTGSSDVVSYASAFSSGEKGIVLVNRAASERVVALNFSHFKPGERYFYYLLTGGTDNGDFSRKVFVNGKTTLLAGGGPEDYATLIPYGTETAGGIRLALPKYSVAYILVEGSKDGQAQEIHFGALSAKTYGDADFDLTATATSGLPVQFAVTDTRVARLTDGKITLTGAGSCDIIAFQEGDSLYLPAKQVVQRLTVAKATQTVDFPEQEPKLTGTPDFDPEATASSGLPVTYTSSNAAVAIIVEGKVRITGAGTTMITARQNGNARFSAATPITRELVVSLNTTVPTLRETVFELFPNPASEQMTIRFPDAGNNPGFTIYDAVGSIVLQHPGRESTVTLPTALLGGPGIYIVKSGISAKRVTVM